MNRKSGFSSVFLLGVFLQFFAVYSVFANNAVIPEDAVLLPKEAQVFVSEAMFDNFDETFSCEAQAVIFVPDQGNSIDYFLEEQFGNQANTFRLLDSEACEVLYEENNFILPEDVRCFDDIFELQDYVRNPIYNLNEIVDGKRYFVFGGASTQISPTATSACDAVIVSKQGIVDAALPSLNVYSTQSNFTLTTPESTYQVGQTALATLRYVLPDDEQGQFQLLFSSPQIATEGDDVLEFDFPMSTTFILGAEVREASQNVAFEAIEEGGVNLTGSAVLVNLGSSDSTDLRALATVTVITPVDTIVNSVDDTAREVGAAGCDTGNMITIDDEQVSECTLRAAIETVNIDGSGNIRFNIPASPASAVPRIVLVSKLPIISVPVIINGTTQSGGRVELFGGLAAINGITLTGGDSTVSGMVFNGFIRTQDGDVTIDDGISILIGSKGNNRIIGNFIGTDSSGTIASATSYGVVVAVGADGNTIGGASESERNIIVAEESGVVLLSNNNRVENNYFGTNVTGSAELSGAQLANGVLVTGSGNTIGGQVDNLGNIIRAARAVVIFDLSQELPEDFGSPSNNNVVQGNRLNVLANGDSPVGGVARAGITITGGSGSSLLNNIIAGHGSLPLVELNPDAIIFSTGDDETLGRIINTTITGNEIGLFQNGTMATNADTCVSIEGESIEEGAPASISNTTIADNKIAGCESSIEVSYAVVGTKVRNNTIGLQFQNTANLPLNMQPPLSGINFLTDTDIVIESNIVVGHLANIRLSANSLTKEPSVGGNGSKFVIKDNTVGVTSTGVAPSGSTQQVGISLENIFNASLSGNTVGEHGKNLPPPSVGSLENFGYGISMKNSPAKLLRENISQNQNGGIIVLGSEPVLIEGVSIFENNDVGINYTAPPHNSVTVFPFKSDPDPNDDILLMFADRFMGMGVPTEDVSGTLEIYGNDDCSNPEGRVPVLTQSINRSTLSDKPFLAAVKVPMRSPIASLNGFTATLTIDGSTSEFSSCTQAMELVDTDGDGAFDLVEGLFGDDKNDDGILDSKQNTVATAVVNFEKLVEGEIPDTGEPILAVLVATEALQNVVWQDTSASNLQPAEGQSAVVDLPFGLVSFEVILPPGTDGGTVQVAVGLIPVQDNQDYIKITNPAFPNEYRVMPTTGNGDRAERLSENVGWLLTLTDGGEYDADGIVNGVIMDPGGPAVISTRSTNSSGSGGGGGAIQIGALILILLGLVLLRAPLLNCSYRR